MRSARMILAVAVVTAFFVAAGPTASTAPQSRYPTIQQFLSPASPQEITSASKADAVAWASYEEGKRNVYAAAAPTFVPVQLTNYTKEDGVMVSHVQISDDGSTVSFMRGVDDVESRQGWSADPAANPDGTDRSIWAARVANPRVAWKVVSVQGRAYELAPDGSSVLFVKDGQIFRARVTPIKPPTEMDRGETPFIKIWGTNSAPKWSPDGKKIAFISNRTDHSFIAVYDLATRTIKYMSPSVDFDTNPIWSADGKHITFRRTPGTPFALQQPANDSVAGATGAPRAGAAGAAAAAPTAGRGNGAGRNGGGRGAAAAPDAQGRGQAGPGAGAASAAAAIPGMARATFKGGYTNSLWTADVATGDAHEVWHPTADDRLGAGVSNFRWAGDDTVIFSGGRGGFGGGRGQNAVGAPGAAAAPATPPDEWDRYYSLTFTQPDAKPVLITTNDGLIEDQTSIKVSQDGKTFYYCTNASDIERRHIWAVPVKGGTPVQVTKGDGIETSPAPLASGKSLATISASWNMTQSVGVWSMATNTQKIVFPATRKDFPVDAHVQPTIVMTKADDGLDIHNQLFLPKDLQPGDKRPALIFVHGGPQREMLLGYHYMQTYHWFYGVNEWLASQGYIVLSVNYRSGIGYGNSFRGAPNVGARGNAEYKDVLAGAKYLQSRPDVDVKRIGIWGLSYGGLLTSEALARNSDIFCAGVDLAGVHLEGNSLDPNDVSYQSSTISQIDKWKSPVLLIQGDDDRNVNFSQMVGLVDLLRQRDVTYELIVFPDDVHESLLHSRWLYAFNRMETFLHKYMGDGHNMPTGGGK